MGTFKTQLLWDSIRKGDLSATSSLLQNGTINPEERDEKGKTFLMLAAECGELNIVRELLEHVDTNAVDNDNWSALLMAAKEGHLEIVIELLDRGADIEHKDMAGWTALMWACYKGHDEVVAELLEKNANPNVKAEYNMTCLAWAAGRGHTEIVKMLLEHDAKVNVTDKYGTTPLIWACRRGYLEIVEALIDARADVNVTGTNSWTALLVATKGGFTEVVGQLLEADPNVNVVDKDGFSALTIAAKEGFIEIAHDLLAKGAYVNVDDRAGDTILIHAVKGGHEEIVRALLNKYADVNVQGAEGKTALYWAVEKGHTEICRLLLDNEPELELCTKDEDTPLMRAVRNRNENCVRLLLDKGAKVSAVDKRGDTALHIALRARSKRITELLLRNPRNSRLLYQSNKSGETPYQIDNYHQKGILTQIFGHRNLNANDGENLLGYDIYSSALADILSDPSLNTPITIGLYAKWGSGKSFLLSKLISEMKTFTKESEEEHFNFSWTLFFFLFIINNIIGFVIAITTKQWEAGLGLGLGLFILEYGFLSLIKMLTEKFQWRYAVGISLGLGRRLLMFSLLFKVLFCNPKSSRSGYLSDVPSVKFLFSESTRLVSVGGEKALAAMVATLGSVLEKEYGMMVARLFRVYKPNMRASGHMTGRFKTLCCIPYFLIVILIMLCIGVGVVLLVIYGISTNTPVNIAMITFAVIVALAVISNFYVWWQSLKAIMFSQEKRILKAADNIDYIKMDGLMQKLKYEVDLMSSMVSCMDKFTETQTRLVVIVDGLDSCEQDKVLQVFDIIKALFSDESSPFITILAVDPHIIIRGIESNIRGTIQDSNVNGFDYLRNAVHLPFYLQSQGMKIQKQELARTSTDDSPTRSKNVQRQDSVWSSYSHLEPKSRKKMKSARRQESYQPSISSSTDIYSVTKSDYFSEVNPRSVRRLMNIVAVTGRLLRAYNIDFSWHRLAAWINLLEQWPYRVSWLILHFEENEMLDDSVTLAQIYEKVLAKIPSSKDIDPLLEIDRNVRKLEAFLSSRSSNSPVLNVGDLKKFLPCTINLDPYLRKLIREMQKNQEPFLMNSMFPMGPNAAPGPGGAGVIPGPSGNPLMAASPGRVPDIGLVQRRTVASPRGQGFGGLTQSIDRIMAAPPTFPPYMGMPYYMYHPGYGMTYPPAPPVAPVPPTSSEKEGAVHTEVKIEGYERQPLSTMSVEDLCSIVARIKGLNKNLLQQYQASLRDNNICGMVLSNCSLEELKEVTQMKFGDWQLFKSAVLFLRKQEEEMVTEEELEELAVAREGGPDDNEPQEEEEEATEGSMLINKGSDHGSQTNRKKSILVSADRGQGSPGPSGYNQKKSVQIKCAKEEAALKSESYRASKQRELSIPGSSSMDVDPAGLVYGELDQQKPMRRNDSIYKQVEYETGLLNSAMMNFTGVEEGQEEEEEEEDYEGEEEQTLLRSDRIDNTTPPPRQGSCMTPPLQRQNSVAESETSASRVKFMLFEENASNSATVETEPVREDTDPLISSSSSLEHKRGMMGSFARTLSSSIEKLSKVIHHPLHHHSSDFSSSDQGHQGQGLGSDLESMQASHSLHSMGFSSPAELSVSSTSVNTGHNIKVRALTHMGSSSQSDAVDIVNETQLDAFKSPRKDHSLKQDIQKYVDSTADTSQPFLTRGAVSTPSLADRGPLVHRDALSFDDDHESKV